METAEAVGALQLERGEAATTAAPAAAARRRSSRNERWIGGLVYLALLIGGITMLVPFAFMLSTSLKPPTQVLLIPPEWIPRPIRLANYADALEVLGWRTFLNTIIFTTSIVLGQGLVTTMGGYGFTRLRFPGREPLFLAYLGTMMIPSQVTMIPAYIVVVTLNWHDTWAGLIVPILASGAFGTFLFRQFFKQIPDELADAAVIDGANHLTIYARIYLPLSRPAMTAYGVITALTAWNMYVWPLIIVKSPELWVLTLALSILSGTMANDFHILMAGVTLSTMPLLVLYLFGQRYFVQGVTMSGLKG
ncbi:MAG TPA: carbohydrate ABC transporter permease [Chloroflexota bacterium]